MQQSIIFINHRRTDTAWSASFLAEKLSSTFGKDQVFQDVRNIQAGDDLSDEILENLARTTVLLVLIGTQWLTAQDKYGRRRLDKEDDWVRREIRSGLEKADCKVIPVLLDDAALPDEAEALPADIRDLLKPKWLQIRQANGDDDVEVLIRVIRESGFESLAISVLSAGQWELIHDLFQAPPVAPAILREWWQWHRTFRSDLPLTLPVTDDGIELFRWLLDRAPSPTGQIPLIIVLQRYCLELDDETRRAAVGEIIDCLARHYKVVPSPLPRQSPPVADKSPAALLVEIIPLGPGSRRCNLRALLFNEGAHPLPVLPLAGAADTPDVVDLGDGDEVAALIDSLRVLLVEHAIEAEQLILEFLLPRDRLDDPVDQWEDAIGQPLGADFSVVVRPRERQVEKRLQLHWSAVCDSVMKCDDASFLDCLWWFDAAHSRMLASKARSGCCIGLAVAPDLAAAPRENPVFQVVYCGGPVAVWNRQKRDPDRFKAELEAHLKGRRLRDLPGLIRKLRATLWAEERADSPCFHLTLLWDDASHRLGEKKPYLEAPT